MVGKGGMLDCNCGGGGRLWGGTGAIGIAGVKRVRRSGFAFKIRSVDGSGRRFDGINCGGR